MWLLNKSPLKPSSSHDGKSSICIQVSSPDTECYLIASSWWEERGPQKSPYGFAKEMVIRPSLSLTPQGQNIPLIPKFMRVLVLGWMGMWGYLLTNRPLPLWPGMTFASELNEGDWESG